MTARDEANEKAPPQRGFFLSASYYRPPGAGVKVEPLGEGLISVLPDGFSPLLAPAAALPALLLMPVPAPIALPDVVPVVEDPVDAPLVAALPATELPLAAPPLDCASAQLVVKTSAAANPIFANFMIVPFVAAQANDVRRRCVPTGKSQFVAVPSRASTGRNFVIAAAEDSLAQLPNLCSTAEIWLA